jgi:Ca-activated chloride channel family protein
MQMLWPGFLLLLGLIPIIVIAYWLMLRRRRVAVRFSSLSLMRELLPRQSRIRRHLPFVLFCLALVSLIIALGRPVSVVAVPTDQTTIILTMDVSRSMCATDIHPSRLQAAQAAANSFIRRQKGSTNIGVVAFSSFAELIQPPTTDPEMLQSAIDSLITGHRTAIGSGILKSLDAIAEIDPNVAPVTKNDTAETVITPVPRGAYVPDVIVLLTDGVSNIGPEPLDAAQEAIDRGVRIYTIGFGTAEGSSFPNCSPQFQGREPFDRGQGFGGWGGWGFGGGGFRRGIDEETLKLVADLTGGEYYSAESASELQNVYNNLPTYLITRHETIEISVIFAALGALLVSCGILLSMLWRPLP